MEAAANVSRMAVLRPPSFDLITSSFVLGIACESVFFHGL